MKVPKSICHASDLLIDGRRAGSCRRRYQDPGQGDDCVDTWTRQCILFFIWRRADVKHCQTMRLFYARDRRVKLLLLVCLGDEAQPRKSTRTGVVRLGPSNTDTRAAEPYRVRRQNLIQSSPLSIQEIFSSATHIINITTQIIEPL